MTLSFQSLDRDAEEVRQRLTGTRNLFSVSELFHENSKIVAAAPGLALSPESLAVGSSGFKRYSYSPVVELPPPEAHGGILKAVFSRRSVRDYSDAALTIGQISDLAFCAAGHDDQSGRPAPSAGGLYPLELYVVALKVSGIETGVYHYDVRKHRLDRIRPGDARPQLSKAIFIESAVAGAAAAFVLTGVFGRSKIKYGERAYRFVLLEAGHVMQNLCLAAETLGLAGCPVGGFVDDHLNDLLDIDGVEEASVYAALLGHPA